MRSGRVGNLPTYWERMPLQQNDKEIARRVSNANSGLRRRRIALRRSDGLSASASLRLHWPEYLMEVVELGWYLFAACAFTTLLQHPASIARQSISSSLARRFLMGLAMGATVIAIVISPWGKQSGGHFNPAITFSYYRLGKVEFWDTWFYVFAQFLGAISGVALARYAFRGALGNDAVRYAVTVPGIHGSAVAFVAELTISFILMITVLFTTNSKKLAPYTAYFVGVLIVTYYTFEAPLSGMSTNPARTLGSAIHANYWHALWIYFIAPVLGMLAGAEVSLRVRGGIAPYCAKLHHANDKRCIFHHARHELLFPEKVIHFEKARKGEST
jgi:aquaporin Z